MLARKVQEKQSDQTWINRATLSGPSSSLDNTYIEDTKVYFHMAPVNLFYKVHSWLGKCKT